MNINFNERIAGEPFLRKGFPRTPSQKLSHKKSPKSLCSFTDGQSTRAARRAFAVANLQSPPKPCELRKLFAYLSVKLTPDLFSFYHPFWGLKRGEKCVIL